MKMGLPYMAKETAEEHVDNAMNTTNLSKLVREAVMIRDIDYQQGNLEAQAERTAVYFPSDSKLGDDTLSQLSFRVAASAFEGMTDEEIKSFIAAQFPEHQWGDIFCTPVDDLLSVMMIEAKAYVSMLIRKRAGIIIYGKSKKKQFMLGLDIDANEVLPFMSENEFVQLVISQFPYHNWYEAHCYQKDGLIVVTLSSQAAKGKSPKELGAKSLSFIGKIYMVAVSHDLSGDNDSLELLTKDLAATIESPVATVLLRAELTELFGKDSVMYFIAEHFPSYTILHKTQNVECKVFSVMLIQNESDELTD